MVPYNMISEAAPGQVWMQTYCGEFDYLFLILHVGVNFWRGILLDEFTITIILDL